MSGAEREAFLARRVDMRLACLDEAGSPYVVPCWHEWSGGASWVIPRARSQWAERHVVGKARAPGDTGRRGRALPPHARGHRRMREARLSDSTRAKHLRVLHACMASAVSHGYAAQNPVARIPEGERPRPQKLKAGYFETDELAPLAAAFPDGLYRTAFLLALTTGQAGRARRGHLGRPATHVRHSDTTSEWPMRTRNPSRDLIVNDIEIAIEGGQLDGMICLSSCDKTPAGHLMALGRFNIPTILVICGYQPSGEYEGELVTRD